MLARFPFSKYLSTISRPSAPSTIIPEEPTMMTISDICLRRQLGQPGTTCALRADKSREGHGRWKSTRMARMPLRGLEGLGGGKESTLKSMKTASRTRKAAGAREGRPRRLGDEAGGAWSFSSQSIFYAWILLACGMTTQGCWRMISVERKSAMETATIHLASNGQITTTARFHPTNCKYNSLSSAEMDLTNLHSDLPLFSPLLRQLDRHTEEMPSFRFHVLNIRHFCPIFVHHRHLPLHAIHAPFFLASNGLDRTLPFLKRQLRLKCRFCVCRIHSRNIARLQTRSISRWH